MAEQAKPKKKGKPQGPLKINPHRDLSDAQFAEWIKKRREISDEELDGWLASQGKQRQDRKFPRGDR